MKKFGDICLPITEEEYRNDGNLHYSTLATYERGGFNSVKHLQDKLDTPSLVYGQAVDTLITGTREDFDKLFLVAEFPSLEPAYINVTKAIFSIYKSAYKRLNEIPDRDIILITEQQEFYLRWKPETRAKVIKEKCEEYYNLLYIAEGKTILDCNTYNDVLRAVQALKESEATKWYFENDNPFDDTIERVYQGKMKAEFDGINYSAMMDLVVIDNKNKIIYPCDLKTSSAIEYDFPLHFIQWLYTIQAQQYAAIIKANIEKDNYFKDFTIANYRFIVVNRESCKPLVWEWKHTFDTEDVIIEKNNGYKLKLRNFKNIGKELHHYLNDNSELPDGINIDKPNDIELWLKK